MGIENLRRTIIPKSDQLNADQLLGNPITITITNAHLVDSKDQPLVINYEGDEGRPYKPCKSMRKILFMAWSDDWKADDHQWIGRSMTLYNDPEVKFGGAKVGGIRISHLSHLPDNGKDLQASLTSSQGKKTTFIIKRLNFNSATQQLMHYDAVYSQQQPAILDEYEKGWLAWIKDELIAKGCNTIELIENNLASRQQPYYLSPQLRAEVMKSLG